mmetsp:Transcript_21070/g.3411  ORF Transcript_21070/g.3411 Transcript_21070/m.3411 type:complete len:186 (+) Transcript_21070:1296-1853(+)
MIFLNNFIPNGDGNQCMGWAWYLANDMQFFLISPLIIYVYHKVSRSLGWGIITTLIYVSMLCGFFVSRHYGLAVAGSDAPGANAFFDEYNKPYTRCGTYLIGLLCGMILYSKHYYDKTGKVYDPLALWFANIVDKFYIRWIFYCIGAVLINVFIFIEYTAWDGIPDHGHDDWSNEARWFWKGCSR